MDFPTYEEVLKLKEEGVKDVWVKLSEKYGKSKDSLRSWFNREKAKRNAYETLLETESEASDDDKKEETKHKVEESTSYDERGNVKFISSNRVILMHEEDKKDPAFVLTAHGFDPEQWILVTCLNNYWQGLRPEDLGSATLYQSKITVKPKVEQKEITYDDIEYFFNNLDSSKLTSVGKIKNTKNRSKTLLINLADAHFGNYTDGFSTTKTVFNLINEIRIRSERYEFKEIIFANLGDLLHVDNYHGQTTSGTQVSERGVYYDVWEDALKSLIVSIDELKKIAPVKYVSICGNHDKVSGFSVGKALEYYYKRDDNISMDCDFEERKYITIGNTLFGLVHGDLPAKNVPSVLQREAREQYGKTKYAYVLLGHVHHTNIVDKDGVIVSHLPSITPTDEWHKGQAYTGTWKGTFCYVVDDEVGITDTWHIIAE